MQTVAPTTINTLTALPTATDLGVFKEVYFDGTNYKGVEHSDLITSPLAAAVTAAKTAPVVSLTTTPFTMPATFFGMHTGGTFPTGITYGALRSHDSNVHWSRLETARGVINSTALALLDSMVADCTANGRHFVYNVPFTPAWASANPTSAGDGNGTGTAWPPLDMADLTNHVNYVLTRYGSQIYAIEGWNEPNTPNVYKGAIADLVVHQQTIWNAVQAYNTAHSTAIKTVSASYTDDPTPTGGISFNAFLVAGGAGYCDVIGYHIYTGNSLGLRVKRDWIASVQTVLANNSINGKELWITEAGDTLIATNAVNNYITRHLLYAAAKGVTKFFWYNYPGGGIGNMGLYQVVSAWQSAIAQLSGKTFQWVNASKSLELGASVNSIVQYV